MKIRAISCLISAVVLAFCVEPVSAQESSSGLDLRATITGQVAASSVLTEAPRSGDPVVGGFRSVVYPTWKMNSNWFFAGAWQFSTRPFYYQDFASQGYGTKGNILLAAVNYARISDQGSVVIRAGEMPTAFGAFPLRYDDADNSLVDLPIEYGYYDSPVSVFSVTGVQLDLTRAKWDSRVQFVNSSAANPHGPLSQNQHGNWAAGLGYTIRQGFRIGFSGYRGPYLDRDDEESLPSKVRLSRFPASAVGIDASWAHGHTNLQGELQHFIMPSPSQSTVRESAGYGEIRQVLNARWYAAIRVGYANTSSAGNRHSVETAVGIRPNRLQIVKLSFETKHNGSGDNRLESTFAVQLVTSLHQSFGRE